MRRALRAHPAAICAAVAMSSGVAATVQAAPLFPPIFRLVSLPERYGGDGSKGVVFRARYEEEEAGRVTHAGDVNGDGVDDVIIGAPRSDGDAPGGAYVVFGRASGFPPLVKLIELRETQGGDGSEGFFFLGVDENDLAGQSISRAGDVNGDGIDDLIICAPRASPGNLHFFGACYVVFGRSTFAATIRARSLFPAYGGDGSTGFVLKGAYEDDEIGGASTAGDVNADGMDDLIVGSSSGNPGYVVFGRASGFPATVELRSLNPRFGGDGTAGFALAPPDSNGQAGEAAGDVNDDGVDDVIIHAGNDFGVAAYTLFGQSDGFPAAVSLALLDPRNGGTGDDGFVIMEIDEHDDAGRALSAAGDINGDGIDDLLIGAWTADPDGRNAAGESYVVFGRPDFAPAFELADLQPSLGGDGSQGFILTGVDAEDRSGRSVSGVSDVNDDGIDDLLVSAHYAEGIHNEGSFVGEGYVVFGRTTGFPAVFELTALFPALGGDGSEGFVIMGYGYRMLTGSSVSGGGDVNGDGIADVLVGQNELNYYGRTPSQAYVVFGRAAGAPVR